MANLTAYQMLVSAAKLCDKQRRIFVKASEKKRDELGLYVDGGCDCLSVASCGSTWGSFAEADEAFHMLKPTKNTDYGVVGFWWGEPSECSDEDHNARIIGLLLAVEIVR